MNWWLRQLEKKKESFSGDKKGDHTPIITPIGRRISIRITRCLLKTGITPNQVTFISFLAGAAAALLFARGEYVSGVLAGILWQIAYLLDLVDGEIARFKNMESKIGAWLDVITDRLEEVLLIFGVTIGVYMKTQNYFIWIYGFLALLGIYMYVVVRARTALYLGGTILSRYDALFDKFSSAGKFGSVVTRFKPMYLGLAMDIESLFILLCAVLGEVILILWIFAVLNNTRWILASILSYMNESRSSRK